MKTLCIYHAACADGLAAAWSVYRALGAGVEFVAAKYGDRIAPELECIYYEDLEAWDCSMLQGRDILIVDFSYPLPVLRAMAAEARSVLVIDHHASAFKEIGNLPKSVEVPLASGGVAYVDETDLPLVSKYSWTRQARGGAFAYIGGGRANQQSIYMHQLILPPKEGLITDHRNRNDIDNRRINLRYATKAQNGANMHRGGVLKGVTEKRNRWCAQITINRENKYLGLFDTMEDAARAYDAAAKDAWGEYARLNFDQPEPLPPNCTYIFDLNRSGAGLTWDYIHPNTPRPRIIDLIEDYARNNPCGC